MVHSRYILKTFLGFAIILLFTKCYYNPSGGNIEYFKKELKVKNPTVYIFNKSLDEVKNIIENEHFRYDNSWDLYQKKEYTEYNKLFEDSSNFNDYILIGFRSNSKNYFSIQDTIPLLYFADFHLHLMSIDSNRTLVQVITYGSWILTGERTFGLVGEFGRNEYCKPVEPTSIEEYEILLKIGEAIGVKDKMPKLFLP